MKIKNQVLLAELLPRGEVDCADKFTSTVTEASTCITKFLLDDIVGYISLLADMGGSSSIRGLTVKRFPVFSIILLSV